MGEDGTRAETRREGRRSLRSHFVGFCTNPSPRWWTSAWLWIIVSIVLWYLPGVGRSHAQPTFFSAIAYKAGAGWTFNPAAGPGATERRELELALAAASEWGGERIRVGVFRADGYLADDTPIPVSADERRGLLQLLAQEADLPTIAPLFAAAYPGGAPIGPNARAMLAAGRTSRVIGWQPYAILAWQWLMLAALVFWICVGVLRRRMTLKVYYAINRWHAGLCPRCMYERRDELGEICPECGIDMRELFREAVRIGGGTR
ncbi:MAG: hypothetical protein H6811_08115 [Phycisphaeraceae bacterium]|nr:hypothetical protein [Phycisphaeraceae bacterium]